MPEQDLNRKAFMEYLLREFPDARVDTSYESVRKVWCFRVSLPLGTIHSAAATEDFLADTPTPQIMSKLESFLLAEHLRDMGSTRVIVTKQGLSMDF